MTLNNPTWVLLFLIVVLIFINAALQGLHGRTNAAWSKSSLLWLSARILTKLTIPPQCREN